MLQGVRRDAARNRVAYGYEYGDPGAPLVGSGRVVPEVEGDSVPFIKAFGALAAAMAGLTIGQTLCIGHFPEGAPDLCTALIHSGSQADNYQVRELVQRVQFTTRGKTHFASQEEGFRIYKSLAGRIGWESNGWKINSIVGGEPIPTGTDSKGRFTHTAHLNVRVRRMEESENGS
jgi:hypothetical protein